MEELIHFRCPNGLTPPTKLHTFLRGVSKIPTASRNALPLLPARGLSLSRRAPALLPEMPPKPPENIPSFHEKILFLESLGIDGLHLAGAPSIAGAPLSQILSTVDLLRSTGFAPTELRRIAGMCPEVLALSPADLVPVFTFLLREANVPYRDLRRVIHRRPRILASDVVGRLRPTLYFLQTLGITAISRHTDLLSCSVEDKLLPRLEFLQRAGFSHRDSRAMARRFPQIFCYSIEGNLKPKFEFFVGEMGRDLGELREFPQFFSFSLPERIRPRHRACEETGVVFTLPALLRPSDEQFRIRMEVCVSSSPPLRMSPLWHQSLNC